MIGTLLSLTILLSDTTTQRQQNLDEVVVTSKGQGGKRSPKGAVATIDEHLRELDHVELIRRGAYAWEPVVNNMQTERVSTTIDGMKIFYACTDKMDPVTSYVESSNLKSILLNSGLNGNPQSTGGIGGSLDLKLRKAGFAANYQSPVFDSQFSAGYETNGSVQVYTADAAWAARSFYTNGGISYRHAGNYKEGGGRTVPFSQFGKVNVFDNFGFHLTGIDVLEGTVIYDRADNVGYPALNMDVKKAEAIITSLAHRHTYENGVLEAWETKVYYNHITHVMDDTKRPDVEIHMDMPGRSSTAGLYSLLRGAYGRHSLTANLDMYYNRLFADMTMYPGGATPMYMVTWPDVRTLNGGLAANYLFAVRKSQVAVSTKISWQQQELKDEEGWRALSVFFPGMKDRYHQTTGRIAANYQYTVHGAQFTVGAGWGSRAPTVTEAYGYYLNNTFDQYDYIGNPRLKNESAVELNGKFQYSVSNLQLSIDASAFFFRNYIIGQLDDRLSPMTVGAEGVKVYGNIPHAQIYNASLSADWKASRHFSARGQVKIARSEDSDGDALPLTAPFGYTLRLLYSNKLFLLQGELRGQARQSRYARKYGETETAAWTIVNLSARYQCTVHGAQFTVGAGIENLFDRRYSSYSDWRDIPQKGRNIYVNASLQL